MKFGTELEFTASLTGATCNKKGNFYDYLQHLAGQCNIVNWKIEQDGSCGNEIVSPILENDKGLLELLQICHLAKKAGDDFGLSKLTGPDCGIHFHFDANDLNHRQIRNVLIITAMAETLFYGMNPLSRFQTNFAAPLTFNLFQCIRARDITDLRDIWFRSYMGVDSSPDSFRHKHKEYFPDFVNSDKKPRKYDWTRYHGLNFVSLFKHGTMEFRYAHGSFDEYNVEMWYRLFLGVMEASVRMRTRDILRTNFPFNMNQVKLSGLPQLQRHLYSDMRRVLSFLFAPKNTTNERIITATVPMMQFIARRLLKFCHQAIPAENYNKLMAMPKDGNADKALYLMLEAPICLPHGSFVPMISQNDM